MIDRIFKNWKTSLVGAILIIVPLCFVAFDLATLSEVAGFWAVALVLFFVKDPAQK